MFRDEMFERLHVLRKQYLIERNARLVERERYRSILRELLAEMDALRDHLQEEIDCDAP